MRVGGALRTDLRSLSAPEPSGRIHRSTSPAYRVFLDYIGISTFFFLSISARCAVETVLGTELH